MSVYGFSSKNDLKRVGRAVRTVENIVHGGFIDEAKRVVSGSSTVYQGPFTISTDATKVYVHNTAEGAYTDATNAGTVMAGTTVVTVPKAEFIGTTTGTRALWVTVTNNAGTLTGAIVIDAPTVSDTLWAYQIGFVGSTRIIQIADGNLTITDRLV